MPGRFDVLHEIERLDPERDHQRIVHLSFGYDFPWDSIRALEIALYRTYCVPSISALLDRTGEFRERTQQRYDDTSILVAEMCEWGYESGRGKDAPFVRYSIYAMLDDAMIAAFGFPRPLPLTRPLLSAALTLRGRFVRWLPARPRPHFFTDSRNRTYPRGYRISELGPPRLVAAERRRTQEVP